MHWRRKRDRDRGRQQHAVRRPPGQRQHAGPRCGEHDRDVARRVDQPAPAQPVDRAVVVQGLPRIQPAADLDRLGKPREGALGGDPGGSEVARRADAEREHHPSGIDLVEGRRRHRRIDRVDRERAQRHQRDLEPIRCRQRRAGQRHRIAQEQMGRDPQRLRPARLGRAGPARRSRAPAKNSPARRRAQTSKP